MDSTAERSRTSSPDIDPQTQAFYDGIKTGSVSIEEFQDRLDKEPALEHFLNSAGFEKRLRKYLERGVTGVFIAVDLDNFKLFNDTNGHPAGDNLIQVAAEILAQQTRVKQPPAHQQEQRRQQYEELDLLGRVGGDEFAVFLVGATMPNAIRAAKRIRCSIVGVVQAIFPDYGPEQTMSLGLSEIRIGDTAKDLRGRADKALYVAKQGKGSGIVEASIAVY